MKKLLIFMFLLIIIYIAAFFVPYSVERFALNPEKSSEVWRFLTYPFIHLNLQHLIENIIGFCLIGFIALELKTTLADFSSTYLSSGFLSAIPIWIIMAFTAAGASNAIFGGFGLVSQEIKKYKIKSWIIILIVVGLIFIKPIIGGFSSMATKQSLAHFSGLMFGIGFFFILKKIKPIISERKRYILRSGGK